MISSVAIVGGTHGNETSGIQLIQNWQRSGAPDLPGAKVSLVTGNPAAVSANVRFIEEDLNRQFTVDRLTSAGASLEATRAREINDMLGPKGNSNTGLVIDIHNTTSNMGATLIILAMDDFNVQLARYVKLHMPDANILLEDDKPYHDHAYLCTTGQRGVMVEVGAQPQGVLREDVFNEAQAMVMHILDYCRAVNNNELLVLPPCEAFRLGENIHYPLNDNGERTAMIHHHLQDQDFVPLLPGQPVFRTFDGRDIVWWEEQETYPHFINEAAYHKLHVAFATASLITL
ncbi:aspartoacylase [Alteromonas sp. CYL-A6]|uniref:aspartoacylase n=1 Tax=Alteromonas nitratireducens TaxID=3390813 RepID=UPI0034ADF003